MTDTRLLVLAAVGRTASACGVSESVYQLVTRVRCPVVTVTAGRVGLAERLERASRPVLVGELPTELLRGIRKRSWNEKLRFAVGVARYWSRIREVCRKFLPTVIYTADLANAAIGLPPGTLRGRRWVAGVRGTPNSKGNWRRAFARADRIIALSQEMAREIENLGDLWSIPRIGDKTQVIYNGVDLSSAGRALRHREEVRSRMGIDANACVALMAGAFDSRKNQLEFIRAALPAALDRSRQLSVIFAGGPKQPQDKAYYEMCVAAARNLGALHRVLFAGNQADIWPWYSAADFVVLPSRSEGMARSMIEGMSAGRPIVTFDVCSAREIVESSGGGIVVPQGDMEWFAESMARLCSDPQARLRMGCAARRFAEVHLSVADMAVRYENLFRSIQ